MWAARQDFFQDVESSSGLTNNRGGDERTEWGLGGFMFKCGALALPCPTSCERQVKSLNLSVPQFSALSRELGGHWPPGPGAVWIKPEQTWGSMQRSAEHTLGSLQGRMERTRERKGHTDEQICLRRYKV